MWLELAVAFSAWTLLVVALKKTGILDRFGVRGYGPFILCPIFKNIPAPKKVNFGWFSILFFVLTMIFYLLLIFAGSYFFPLPSVPFHHVATVTPVGNFLLIPMINEFIPVWLGWIGLLVALFVHELGHAFASEGKTRALGIVFAPIPIGAFADVDEQYFFDENRPRFTRTKLICAGVAANLLVALLAFFIFFVPVLGGLEVTGNVSVDYVVPGSHAEKLGIVNGMIITRVDDIPLDNASQLLAYAKNSSSVKLTMVKDGKTENQWITPGKERGIMVVDTAPAYPARYAGLKRGVRITNIGNITVNTLSEFINYMNTTHPGQMISLGLLDNGTERNVTLILANPPENISKGWLGIVVSEDILGFSTFEVDGNSFLNTFKNVVLKPRGIQYLLIAPMASLIELPGFSGFNGVLKNLFQPAGILKFTGSWYLSFADILFWIGWMNIQIALFNSLPIYKLDGGLFLKEALDYFCEKLGLKKNISVIIVKFVTVIVIGYFLYIIFSKVLWQSGYQ
ncbi:Peptidase family M50 [uncultured archaeon]|nr:Peptidase family M50 [uncultured archaeon]